MQKQLINYFSIFIILLFFISCGSTKNAHYNSDMPDWVYHHYESEDKRCGIGFASSHIRGIAYQRALAISRAIDEIAKQLNVTVDTTVETYMLGSNSSVSSGLSSFSVQTTTGQSVQAGIIDAWMDEYKNEFYVLMCTDSD